MILKMVKQVRKCVNTKTWRRKWIKICEYKNWKTKMN